MFITWTEFEEILQYIDTTVLGYRHTTNLPYHQISPSKTSFKALWCKLGTIVPNLTVKVLYSYKNNFSLSYGLFVQKLHYVWLYKKYVVENGACIFLDMVSRLKPHYFFMYCKL